MAEIKRPRWDTCEGLTGIWQGTPDEIGRPLPIIRTITAKYKGRAIRMRITNEPTKNIFEAEIFDIEPDEDTYEGLSIGDIVEVDRASIYYQQK